MVGAARREPCPPGRRERRATFVPTGRLTPAARLLPTPSASVPLAGAVVVVAAGDDVVVGAVLDDARGAVLVVARLAPDGIIFIDDVDGAVIRPVGIADEAARGEIGAVAVGAGGEVAVLAAAREEGDLGVGGRRGEGQQQDDEDGG